VVLNGFGDATAIEAMVAQAPRDFSPVDILVNNAGILPVAAIEEFRTAK
jgi:NAD(P)-dependent dehydrogenase (short-subunit alcohol dehydrogenase family)